MTSHYKHFKKFYCWTDLFSHPLCQLNSFNSHIHLDFTQLTVIHNESPLAFPIQHLNPNKITIKIANSRVESKNIQHIYWWTKQNAYKQEPSHRGCSKRQFITVPRLLYILRSQRSKQPTDPILQQQPPMPSLTNQLPAGHTS